MDKHSNDFLSLPIIISDYDALTTSTAQTPSISSSETSRTTEHKLSISLGEQATRWTTDFASFTDALFSKMTRGAKTKLREACVEVLRRTEDVGEEEVVFGGWGEETEDWGKGVDGDARFLD